MRQSLRRFVLSLALLAAVCVPAIVSAQIHTVPADRFEAKVSPWADVRAYGARCDDATDDSAAFQAAINATAAGDLLNTRRGAAIYVPAGGCRIYSKITLRTGVRIFGDSHEASRILSFVSNDDLFYYDADATAANVTKTVQIDNLTILGRVASTGAYIHLTGSSEHVTPTLRNLYIYGYVLGATGIRIKNSIQAHLDMVMVQGCAGSGFLLEATNNIPVFTSTYAAGNGGDGYTIYASQITMNSPAADGNSGDGYHLQVTGLTMNSPEAEDNHGAIIHLASAHYVTINSGVLDGSAASTDGLVFDASDTISVNNTVVQTSDGTPSGYSIKLINAPTDITFWQGYAAAFGSGTWYNPGNVPFTWLKAQGSLDVAYGLNTPDLGVSKASAGVNTTVRLTNSYDSTDAYHGSAIEFSGSAGAQALISASENPLHWGGGVLRLQTYTNAGALNTGIAVLRTGEVGIGTAVPSAELEVYSPSMANIVTNYGGTSKFKVETGNGYTTIGTTTSTPLVLAANDVEWMRIIPGGEITFTGSAGSDTYASQTTGWRVTNAGAADFRYLYTDELHAKSFIADLEQALAGGQIISKSVAVVSSFTCPAAGATATLAVEDLPGAADMQVFQANDWVALRSFSRSGGGLAIADCVGQVSAPDTSPAGTQNWTFTRGSGGNAGTMSGATVVLAKSLALDYGVSGNGYYEVNSIDGTYGANSPYMQIATWATSPVAANRTVRLRTGQLIGVTGTSEYGIVAGTYAATNGSFFRASDTNVDLQGITAKWWDGTTNVVTIAPNSGSPYIGLGSPAPSACCTTAGVFLGWDHAATKAKASFYSDTNNYLTFDGTKVTWKAANTALDASGNLTASSATLSGAITATSGAIGGFTVGATELYAGTGATRVEMQSSGGFWAGATAFADAPFSVSVAGALKSTSGAIGGWTLSTSSLVSGSAGTTVGLDSGGTNPAIYAGSATPASAPFRVTHAGALTATSGAVGGWTLGATSLTSGSGATTVGLDSGGTNPAIYAGSSTPSSAPFRVTKDGALTATGATLTNGQIVFDNGSFMRVSGTGFGSSNQFIEWWGPHQAALASCTEANATYYLKADGTAYFGGALLAGVLKNSVTGTVLNSTNSAVLGPYASNGNTITINWSLDFYSTKTYAPSDSAGWTAADRTAPTATLKLERSVSGGSYSTVWGATICNGSVSAESPNGTDPGYITKTLVCSGTSTDPDHNTNTRAYRLSFVSNSHVFVPGVVVRNNLALVSIEQ